MYECFCPELQEYLTIAKANFIKIWVDPEQHISELIWQGQKHHQEHCDYGVLQWKTGIVSRVRYIRNQPRGNSSVSEGQNEIPKEWNSTQCSALASNIHKQNLNKCGNLLQQHRMTSTRYTIWPKNSITMVSPLR